MSQSFKAQQPRPPFIRDFSSPRDRQGETNSIQFNQLPTNLPALPSTNINLFQNGGPQAFQFVSPLLISNPPGWKTTNLRKLFKVYIMMVINLANQTLFLKL